HRRRSLCTDQRGGKPARRHALHHRDSHRRGYRRRSPRGRERDSRHARMKPARMLVVDDEPGIRQSMCGVLEDEGYHARPGASGEQCLEDLTREPSELVLLDVWLPGIDGMETLARIQEIPIGDRPAVVMISGHGNIEAAVK